MSLIITFIEEPHMIVVPVKGVNTTITIPTCYTPEFGKLIPADGKPLPENWPKKLPADELNLSFVEYIGMHLACFVLQLIGAIIKIN